MKPGYEALIEEVRADHVRCAGEFIKSDTLRKELEGHIDEELQQVTRVLDAAATLGEVIPRCVDKVISAGEKLSCRFMTTMLQDRGYSAEYVDVSEILAPSYTGELDQAFYDGLAKQLADRVRACQHIPVITGFFGMVSGGLLQKVGRGYTDLCAALVAVGLDAEELQVWKEVDGIYTADPRKVPTARLLPQITPAEAAELTFYGSEVIHPFTMEQVIRARIPIRIKNVMNPRRPGTVILPEQMGYKLPPTSDRAKRPTAVTLKHKILVINIHSNRKSLSHGFFAKIFSILDKWRLSVDLISTSEVHVSMALHSEAVFGGGDELRIDNHELRSAYEELQQCGTVDLIPNLAILSLVGQQMNHMMGVAGKMFSTLGDHNVNIEMISQGRFPVLSKFYADCPGASEINISCVIEERDADRALNIVHTNLFTFLE